MIYGVTSEDVPGLYRMLELTHIPLVVLHGEGDDGAG